MNSNSAPPAGSKEQTAPGPGLRLFVRGLGHVPAAKNSRMPARHKDGVRSMILTKPKVRRWKSRCTDAFACQCISAMRTCADATLTANLPQFLTVSLPADDNCFHIAEIGPLTWSKVKKGEEGADILIEPLP